MFNCKVAMIIGGTGYIGSKIVKELINRNARCLVVDYKKDKINAMCKELQCIPNTKINYFLADIANSQQLKNAFKEADIKYNRLDFVINCAAIVDEKHWTQMVDTNLIGAIQTIYYSFAFLPKLKQSKHGTVLTLTNNVGFLPFRQLAAYGAIGNYMVGVTQAIGNPNNLKKYCTKVCTICLGLTNTPLYYCNRSLFEEVADKYPIQEVDEAVKGILKILENPINGAVYEIEDGKSHLLAFKERSELKV